LKGSEIRTYLVSEELSKMWIRQETDVWIDCVFTFTIGYSASGMKRDWISGSIAQQIQSPQSTESRSWRALHSNQEDFEVLQDALDLLLTPIIVEKTESLKSTRSRSRQLSHYNQQDFDVFQHVFNLLLTTSIARPIEPIKWTQSRSGQLSHDN
jgi:hypothetical protein